MSLLNIDGNTQEANLASYLRRFNRYLSIFCLNRRLCLLTGCLARKSLRIDLNSFVGKKEKNVKNVFHFIAPNRTGIAEHNSYRQTSERLSRVVRVFAINVLLIAAPATVAQTSDDESDVQFYKERSDGWHWYEDPPPVPFEEPNKDYEPLPVGGSDSRAGPAPLSAAWMRETLPVLRDAAIDNPTDENVAAYFYAQRIMMDKAQVFSDKAQQVVTNDPLLDENLRLPFASAAKVSFLQSANDAKRQIIDDLAERAGLWFFYDETCSYCSDQVRPMNKLVADHGITVEVIHKNGESVAGLSPEIKVRRATGQFEALGINFTPAVMMVAPPDGYYLISQGFTSHTTLVDRIIAAANQYGLINEDEYLAAVPTAKGVLRSDRIDGTEIVSWQRPDEWVPFIRNKIAETYGIELPNEDDHEN